MQLLDRSADGSRIRGSILFPAQMRVVFVELPYLSVGAPTPIAVARMAQVDIRELVEPARPVEARSHFVGDRFVVDEAIVTRRTDRLLVQVLGIEHPAFEAGEFGADQRGAVFEILRAVVRTDLQLPVMRSQSVEVVLPLDGGCRVATAGPDQCVVKVIFSFLEKTG